MVNLDATKVSYFKLILNFLLINLEYILLSWAETNAELSNHFLQYIFMIGSDLAVTFIVRGAGGNILLTT